MASERSVKAKRIAHDGEKPLAGDGLSLNDLAKETLEERDARLKPSPKGARCESVESLIKRWKQRGRQTSFASPLAIPPSTLDQLAVAATTSRSLSPTSSDVNNAPFIVLAKGQSIDYSKLCASSFGEAAYATESGGREESSVG